MSSASAPSRVRRSPGWLVALIAAGFGLLYAYVVWNAIGLLVSQATGPLGLNVAGWLLLLSAAIFPPVIFGIAFAVGHRRKPAHFALILLCGLTLSAVFWFNVVAFAATAGATLLG